MDRHGFESVQEKTDQILRLLSEVQDSVCHEHFYDTSEVNGDSIVIQLRVARGAAKRIKNILIIEAYNAGLVE